MIFMRSAARAISLKSIIAWLPNECLYIILECLATPDLAAMCRTSRLLRNMGTQMLYRYVTICSEVQLERFLEGFWRGVAEKESPVRMIRLFVLEASAVRGHLIEAQGKKLTTILCNMSALEFIRLQPYSMDYSALFQKARFPALATFHGHLRTETAVAATDFLNRHSATLNSVTIINPYPIEFAPGLQRICLPGLRDVCTRPLLLELFDFNDVPLTKITFLTHASDADTSAASFANLRGVSTLQNVTVLSYGDRGQRLTLLHIIAANLPHVQNLTFTEMWRNRAPISHDDSNTIAAALEKFDALKVLEFRNAVGNPSDTVVRWGNACQSLQSIRLNGVTFERRETDWPVTKKRAVVNSDAEDHS
ncbi:hypothetical protein R3P38DRAFT_3291036 [Favolaschia claudopus]|uniref:F-box domain-containing protein n=1 Tax=Favolaschia claudopus TaxID=2862362 RepID=A0AAV9ZQI0_9AGAR